MNLVLSPGLGSLVGRERGSARSRGSYQPSPPPGDPRAFVARLSPAGNGTTDLEYSTFLGGSQGQTVIDVALDEHFGAYVAGRAASSDFPTTRGAYQTTFGGGQRDGWVASLDLLPAGTQRYGAGTPGSNGITPVIAVNSIPARGNSTFAITCKGALPFAPGVFGLSGGALCTGLPSCAGGIWIDIAHPLFIYSLQTSGPLGASSWPIAIPNVPALAGFTVAAQFLWVDALAAGGYSASGPLLITVQ